MLCYDANDWHAYSGSQEFKLTKRHWVKLHISCSKPVTVFAVKNKKKVPISHGENLQINAIFQDFHTLLVVPQGKTEFGMKTTDRPRQIEEPHDPSIKAPVVPVQGPADNLLQQIHRAAKAQRKANMPPVMEPEAMTAPGVQTFDDDELPMFEEEEIALSQQMAREQRQAEVESTELPETDPAPEALEEPSEPSPDDPPQSE